MPSNHRNSPTFFRRKSAAIIFCCLVLAALVLVCYWGLGMLARYDYGALLPEDAPLRVTLTDEPFTPATPAPTVEASAMPTPLPTPRPHANPTPLPLAYYNALLPRMAMPKEASAPGEAVISDLYVSEADDNKGVMVTGYAYLDGCDAERSSIYLVVSAGSGAVRHFYEASILPGSSGIVHDPTRGENLERADFRATFNVRAYGEGFYHVGLLVVNRAGRRQVTNGYFEFPASYDLAVRSNAVYAVG